MIYDCFSYWDEDTLLELRLNILNDIVDCFVIVEGNKTWQNNSKKLRFDLNRFKKSLKQNNFKKIIYKSALYSNMNSLINLKPSRVIKGKAFKYNIFTVDQENA